MKEEELKRQTCCGIVLYNPDIEKLKKNIDCLLTQVQEIILVDNASVNYIEIKQAVESYHIPIIWIKNDKNHGIAKALNQILDYAYNHQYSWYLTMDQDSYCSETLIKEYASVIEGLDNVAILCPYVLNNNKITFKEYKSMDLPVTETVNQPIDCITSASLNNVSAAIRCGGYNNNLFIDCVDVEFNIRTMLAGYNIIKVNRAYMFQTMGEGKEIAMIQFLYKKLKIKALKQLSVTPVYNDLRLYFIARNSKYIRQKYHKYAGRRMSFKWMMGQFIYYSFTYPLSRSRICMWKHIIKGLKDSKKIEAIL